MPLPNAYAQYNNSKVLTASPAELTLMLYEGAIKFCNIAITAIEEKDIPKAHNNIVKVQKIIDHLRATLDMKYPVAKEFDNIYVSFSGGKDSGLLLNLTLEFRDRFYPQKTVGVFHQDFEAQDRKSVV